MRPSSSSSSIYMKHSPRRRRQGHLYSFYGTGKGKWFYDTGTQLLQKEKYTETLCVWKRERKTERCGCLRVALARKGATNGRRRWKTALEISLENTLGHRLITTKKGVVANDQELLFYWVSEWRVLRRSIENRTLGAQQWKWKLGNSGQEESKSAIIDFLVALPEFERIRRRWRWLVPVECITIVAVWGNLLTRGCWAKRWGII